jgi:hypothetical protein
MKSAATTDGISVESTAEAATDPASIITINVSTPKAAEEPVAVVVGIIVVIAV